MERGIHGPNAPWTEADFWRVTASRATAVKLMDYHTARDVQELRRRGVTSFLVRLPDSTGENGRWKGLGEWWAQCDRTVAKFLPEGITDYQLDNEPNQVWPMTPNVKDDYPWLVGSIAIMLCQKYSNIRLGLAPLAWNFKTWTTVRDFWIPIQRKIASLHDFVCIHSYWQKPTHFNDPSYGGNCTHWADVFFPGYDQMVTEWGDSSHEISGLSPVQVESRRVLGYPAWQNWIDSKPYVKKAFLYIAGGTPEWSGYWPTDKVLRTL